MPAALDAPPAPKINSGAQDKMTNRAIELAFEGKDPSGLTTDLFEETPKEEKSSPPPKEEKKDTPPPDKKEEEQKPEPEDKEEKKPEPKEGDLDNPPEGATLPRATNKDLRSQLEQRNAAFKKLEGEKALQEEELTSLRREVEELRGKSTEDKGTPTDIDFKKDPKVASHIDAILNDVRATARTIGGTEGKKLQTAFQTDYFPAFLQANAKDGVEGDEAIDTLRERLNTDLGETGARDAMSLLNRSLPGYEMASAELNKLKANAHNYRHQQNVEKYSTLEKEFKAILDPLGELPEDVMVTKPHAPESFVSKLIQSDPKWLARSQQVKKEILEIFAGVKPLTPDERSRLEANDNGGLTHFEETRQKQFGERRNAMMKRLYHSMMILPNLPSLLEELEGLRASKSDEDSERDALSRVPEAPAPKVKEEKPAIPSKAEADKLIDDAFKGRGMFAAGGR